MTFPAGYPKGQRAVVDSPLPRPRLVHVLAFRLVDRARKWRVTL